jgi:hypothetical protein
VVPVSSHCLENKSESLRCKYTNLKASGSDNQVKASNVPQFNYSLGWKIYMEIIFVSYIFIIKKRET